MAQGSRDQWLTEVVERWEQPLRDYARRWLRDEALARDVVQETLFRVWRATEVKIGDVQAVRGYAYRVCRNLCIDQLRTRREEIEPDFAPRGVTDPEARLGRRERAERVLARLQALPARQQEILHLKLIDGLSYREIAAATGLTTSNVGFLLHTSIMALQAEAEGSDINVQVAE